jgi:hypothetical protein
MDAAVGLLETAASDYTKLIKRCTAFDLSLVNVRSRITHTRLARSVRP